MDYQIVELEDKVVVGITTNTRNSDKDMPQVISDLWHRFYDQSYCSAIKNRKDEKDIGLYSDYKGDEYSATVCCEVSKAEDLPEGTVKKVIPSGKYAKFIVRGEIMKVVPEFWTKLWAMNIDRKYTADFEEYQAGSTPENALVHIYISVN